MPFKGWTIIRQKGAQAAMEKSPYSLVSSTARTVEVPCGIKGITAAESATPMGILAGFKPTHVTAI